MLFSLALWVESQQADEMNACCSGSKFDHGDYTYRSLYCNNILLKTRLPDSVKCFKNGKTTNSVSPVPPFENQIPVINVLRSFMQ